MTRRPRVWRHMWLAYSLRPVTLENFVWTEAGVGRWRPDNDNTTPVKALSLDVERWMAKQGAR